MTFTSFQTTPGTRPVRSASSTLRNGSPARVRRAGLALHGEGRVNDLSVLQLLDPVSPAIRGQSIRLLAMSSTATRTALEPLRALRYDQSKVDLADVVAPPYDVVTAGRSARR